MNQVQQIFKLKDLLSELSEDENENQELRHEIQEGIPAHIKACIHRKFGHSWEADRMMNDYLKGLTVKNEVDKLYRHSRMRV